MSCRPVDVAQVRLDGPGPLGQARGQDRPLVGRDHPRHQIDRERPLVPADAEGQPAGRRPARRAAAPRAISAGLDALRAPRRLGRYAAVGVPATVHRLVPAGWPSSPGVQRSVASAGARRGWPLVSATKRSHHVGHPAPLGVAGPLALGSSRPGPGPPRPARAPPPSRRDSSSWGRRPGHQVAHHLGGRARPAAPARSPSNVAGQAAAGRPPHGGPVDRRRAARSGRAGRLLGLGPLGHQRPGTARRSGRRRRPAGRRRTPAARGWGRASDGRTSK